MNYQISQRDDMNVDIISDIGIIRIIRDSDFRHQIL